MNVSLRNLATFTVALTIAVPLLAGVGSVASAQQGAAGRFLKQKHDVVNRILNRPARSDADRERRGEEINGIIRDLLDYDTLSQESLGDHWEAQPESAREEFVSLLRQLVERNYQNNLENTLEYRITYGDEEQRGGTVIVHTTAQSRENRRAPAVEIDYKMRRAGSRWVVVDVITDGVSMVRNYRNQFGRIIRRDGWDGLIERMRNRLERGAD